MSSSKSSYTHPCYAITFSATNTTPDYAKVKNACVANWTSCLQKCVFILRPGGSDSQSLSPRYTIVQTINHHSVPSRFSRSPGDRPKIWLAMLSKTHTNFSSPHSTRFTPALEDRQKSRVIALYTTSLPDNHRVMSSARNAATSSTRLNHCWTLVWTLVI